MTIELYQPQHLRGTWPDSVGTSCYVNAIPPFAEAELTRLYGHIHSSLAFFRTSRPTDDVSTYVAWRGDRPVALLVFQLKEGVVSVFNEFIAIGEDELCRFAQYIFDRFDTAQVIRFEAVRTAPDALPFPWQKHNSKEDWVIELPPTPADYLAVLGKSTREKVKRYTRKVNQDFRSLSWEFYEKGDITEEQIRSIVRLSEARISAKRKKFGIDENEVRRIIRLAAECGFVSAMRLDGRLCAGMICYRIGSAVLTEVIAHDPQYNHYRLGLLCYYATICECIARGARTYHLGGGRQEYKARLRGVRQDMDCLEIYRSRVHALVNLRRVTKTFIDGYLRRAKVWMLEREESVVTRSVLTSVYFLHKLRCRKATERRPA